MLKVGDKVKCIDQRQFCFPKVGEFYEITRIDKVVYVGVGDVAIKDKAGFCSNCIYPQGMFVKVEEERMAKFEAGKKIRCVNTIDSGSRLTFEKLYELLGYDPKTTNAEMEIIDDNGCRSWWKEGRFIEVLEIGDTARCIAPKGWGNHKWIDRLPFTVTQKDLACIEFRPQDFIKEATMSKYQELKERIENLQNGWDKEADDILAEIFPDNSGEIYRMTIPVWRIVTGSCIEIRNATDDKIIQCFRCRNQCEKLDAFKQALLWLLDHSDIKKDEKEEKIKELFKQIKPLQEQIEELRR